ncbi:hypothetical protein LUZ62_075274 [Rhynchospora pubera]|uniref:mannan endo-1,4-beta-mannosidase n=1 Tax=Rhynchospora pubera TaxID=906938 RepID=A0AAV8AMA3_9POAL|nr:hypothetical protein LUZ62_009583 [Rhynchospora pubera]KAJ4764899.1 hypothetical protein LUZ62_075274 [Rhynchospora pubera]
MYKDDPSIFAWELINEPRCQNDLSGRILQNWITEMTNNVKSIDNKHLLEIGLEGFYGESVPERKQFNPGYEVGTDFISNNKIQGVDFANIHAYPDQWISGSNDEAQLKFTKNWLESHIQDATALGKPLMFTEFGKSSHSSGYNVSVRDSFLRTIYDAIYASARAGGACAGGLFWQVMAQGMEGWSDGYEVVFSQCPSTASVIQQQSRRIAGLN